MVLRFLQRARRQFDKWILIVLMPSRHQHMFVLSTQYATMYVSTKYTGCTSCVTAASVSFLPKIVSSCDIISSIFSFSLLFSFPFPISFIQSSKDWSIHKHTGLKSRKKCHLGISRIVCLKGKNQLPNIVVGFCLWNNIATPFSWHYFSNFCPLRTCKYNTKGIQCCCKQTTLSIACLPKHYLWWVVWNFLQLKTDMRKRLHLRLVLCCQNF